MLRRSTRRHSRQVRHKTTTGKFRLPLNFEHLHVLVNSDRRSNNNCTRMGKVAIIHDTGAITCVQYNISLTDYRAYLPVAALKQCCISYTQTR